MFKGWPIRIWFGFLGVVPIDDGSWLEMQKGFGKWERKWVMMNLMDGLHVIDERWKWLWLLWESHLLQDEVVSTKSLNTERINKRGTRLNINMSILYSMREMRVTRPYLYNNIPNVIGLQHDSTLLVY